MTPEEWERCDDPRWMLYRLAHDHLARSPLDRLLSCLGRKPSPYRPSERKHLLFSCACGRRMWPRLDGPNRTYLELLERFAEGQVDERAVAAAWPAAQPGCPDTLRPGMTWIEATYAGVAPYADSLLRDEARRPDEGEEQARLLRDIFGYPFRPPPPLAPPVLAYNGGAARRLAEAICAARRFEDLPVLADLFEESGCTDAALLGHLRGPGPHALGCHALDAVLGKT
jgi:hypothetical protein